MTDADELHKRAREQAGDLDLLTILEENIRLQAEVDSLKALFDRPIQTSVQIQSPEQSAIAKILEYLPQLTHLSTNVSAVASAGQENGRQVSSAAAALMRIATALEKATGGVGGAYQYPGTVTTFTQPIDDAGRRRLAQYRGMSCSCDGVTHSYQPGWCPPEGPRFA